MNIAIILAGGSGIRVGGGTPKQFLKIKNKPLIAYTLEKFEKNKNIDSICIVTNCNYIDLTENICKEYDISKCVKIVEGGTTGLESAINGIKSIEKMCQKTDVILIHDAVRPLVNDDIINDNIEVCKQHGCSMTSVPLLETLIKSNGVDNYNEIINRDSLFRIQTPQSYIFSEAISLYKEISKNDLNMYPSSFAYYVSKGKSIYLSKGNELNFKVTWLSDFKLLESIL